MPGPKPLSLTLNDTQRALLQRLVRRQTSPQRLVWRAQTILAAAEGAGNAQLAHNSASSAIRYARGVNAGVLPLSTATQPRLRGGRQGAPRPD